MTLRADRIRSRRQLVAAPGGSHDRIVRFLAMVLPGLIGALLAIMVLAPLSPRGEISFLLDRTKVAMVDDRLRVLGAMYRGQDDKGRAFSVTAGSAVQHSARQHYVALHEVTARMLLDDGPAILTADDGTYDFSQAMITVPGPVDFQTSDGYRMITKGARINLDHRRMTSIGAVEGRIPTGTFTADRISADFETRVVTLDGHAHLHMIPGKLQLPGKAASGPRTGPQPTPPLPMQQVNRP